MLNCRFCQEWVADIKAPPHVKLNNQAQSSAKEK
jgi:hypothetical protein